MNVSMQGTRVRSTKGPLFSPWLLYFASYPGVCKMWHGARSWIARGNEPNAECLQMTREKKTEMP